MRERSDSFDEFCDALMPSLSDIVFEIDSDFIFRRIWTPRPDLLFAPPEQTIGRRVRDVLGELGVPFETMIATTLSTGRPQSVDYVHPGNEALWFNGRSSVAPKCLSGTKPTVFFVVRDISERVQADRQHLASLTQTRALLANLLEGVVVQASDGRIIDFNAASLRILGLTEGQMMGRDSFDPRWKSVRENGEPLSGADHPAMLALRTGQAQRNFVMGVQTPGGELRWISINSVPIAGPDGKPERVLSTFQDVTDVRQSVKDLENANARMTIAIRAVEFGVWDWDIPSNVLVWDDQMYRVFGVRREDFGGAYEAFEAVLLPEDATRVREELESVFQPGEGFGRQFSSEFRIRHSDGRIRVIRGVGEPFFDEKGRAVRLLGVNWDITEEREREVMWAHAAKMAGLGEVVAGIAHEINNPLALIVAKAELALEALSGPGADLKRIGTLLSGIESTARRIADVVQSLKHFAHDEDEPQWVSVSVSDLVEDAVALIQTRLQNHEISLTVELPSSELTLECNRSQVAQVILSLLANAHDAVLSQNEKWIRIRVEAIEGDCVAISVTDSGPGIPKDHLAKLTQPFFTTKDVGEGRGLSLSVARGIAEGHGGRLTFDLSCPQTRFVLRLPRVSPRQKAA